MLWAGTVVTYLLLETDLDLCQLLPSRLGFQFPGPELVYLRRVVSVGCKNRFVLCVRVCDCLFLFLHCLLELFKAQ